jgi:hypothetical protein
MPRGGRRPGAGRKPTKRYTPMVRDEAVVYESPVPRAEQRLCAALPDLVDIAIGLARAGDRRMLVYCIDRVLGSPVARAELGERGAFAGGFEIRLLRVGDGDGDAATA